MKFLKYPFIFLLLLLANFQTKAQCNPAYVPVDSNYLWAFSSPICGVAGETYEGHVNVGLNTVIESQGISVTICRLKIDSITWSSPNTISFTAEHNGIQYTAGQEINLNVASVIDSLCLNLSGNIQTLTNNPPLIYATLRLYLPSSNCAGNPLVSIPITEINNNAPDTIRLEVVNDIGLCPGIQNELIVGNVLFEDANTPGNDTARCGTIYFYDSANNPFIPVDSLYLTSSSPFHWLPIGNGSYTARYLPCDSLNNSVGAMATYYSSTAFWTNADSLSVGSNNPNIFYVLQDTAQLQGPVTLTGFIYDGLKSDKAMGVADVSVFLKNTADDIIGYTQTNGSGKYTFSNLPYGTYVIYPEVPGVTTTPYTVTVNVGDSTETAADFLFAGNEISPILSHAGLAESGILSARVAPNPTGGMAYLSLTAVQGQTIHAYMVDMQGKTVWQYNTSVSKGAHTLTLDLTSVAPGLYSLHLGSRGWNSTQKMLIAR